MTILNRIASNWSFQEREKLNNNWTIIESYLSKLQGQLNILTGDVDVQELVAQINDILNQSNVIIDDLETALQEAITVISNAQNATIDADNAAQNALNAIIEMQAFINQIGNAETYDNSKLYKVNNLVEFDGSGYICIQDTQGNSPPLLPAKRNDWWQLFAQKGLDGTGAVSKVAGKSPEVDGNVSLNAQDVGAVSVTEYNKFLMQRQLYVTELGAIGDWNGTSGTDNTTAIQNALNTSRSLHFPRGIYRITGMINTDFTGIKEITITGDDATIILDSPTHIERMIFLKGQGVKINIDGITFDGNKKCNKVLEFDNETINMSESSLGEIIISNSTSKNAKRLNIFNGGCAIYTRGAYRQLCLENVVIENCELPQGQGTMGLVGIGGLIVSHYGLNSYTLKTILNNCHIEKIYSSDLNYQHDQDGIMVFAPHINSLGKYVQAELIVDQCTFINCYGRSIKSQTFVNTVANSFFKRTEGLNSKIGNGEIDFQISGGIVENCTFDYSNGYHSNWCIIIATDVGYGYPSSDISNCYVYLDDLTILESFLSTFHRTTSALGRINVSKINIFGKVTHPIEAKVNGNKEYLTISNMFVAEIVNGRTSEKALVYVSSDGSVTPRILRLSVHSCQYAGSDLPAIVRDGISGNAATAIIDAFNNIGFANDKKANTNITGLRKGQVARIGKIGADLSSDHSTGFFEVKTVTIGANETMIIPVQNISTTLLFIISSFGQNSFAIISSKFTNNVTVAKGTDFEIGNTTEPATGTFRVWSSGENQISIKNTNTSGRVFSIFEMCPY